MPFSYCGFLQVGSGFWNNVIPFSLFVFMELFMSPGIIYCCLHMSDLLLSLCRALCVCSCQQPIVSCREGFQTAPTTELSGLVLKPSEAKYIPAYNFQFFFFLHFLNGPIGTTFGPWKLSNTTKLSPQQSISI